MPLNDGGAGGNAAFPFIWGYVCNKAFSRSAASIWSPQSGFFAERGPAIKRMIDHFYFNTDVGGTRLNNFQGSDTGNLSSTEKIR